MRKTLEPQARSASTRFENRLRSEASLRTRRRFRRRAVAERALRRNPRPAGHSDVLPRAGADPLPKYRFRGTSAGIQNVPEADRTNVLPPSALQRRSKTSAVSVCHHLALGTGFEPATARLLVWCSIQAELTGIGDDRFRTHVRNTESQSAIPLRTESRNSLRRWTAGTNGACFQRDAGGSRTHTKPLCRRPPYRLAPTSIPFRFNELRMSSPGFEPGPRPSQSRVRSTTLRGRSKHIRDQYPAEDSNLVRQLRRLPCVQHTRRARSQQKSRREAPAS